MGLHGCDTLIISDLHLGANVSRAREALCLLKQTSFRRLILLGDMFCDLNFARLKKDHWSFLSYIRKLSNPKRQIEVVWVEGNHDRGLSDVMSHLVGVRVYQEYQWAFGGKRFLAIHGHQFDRWFINNGFVSKIGTWMYLELQKLDSRQKRLSRLLDRMNTAWLRLSPKVCAGALALAERRGADVVFCGHTHHAMSAVLNGVRYYNCGAWVHEGPTFITVDADGVQIRAYTPRTSGLTPDEFGGDESELEMALDEAV